MDKEQFQMTYSDLYRHLSDLTPEQLQRDVVLYDTLSGHTHPVTNFLLEKEDYKQMNLPFMDEHVAVITF